MNEQSEKIEKEEMIAAPEEKAKRSRKKRKFGKKEILMLVLPALAAVIAVIVASVFVEHASEQKTAGAGRQYYLGTERQVGAGNVIKKTEDGRTLVENEGVSAEIAELPIYYDDKKGFKITEDMICFDPRSGKHPRADHFTDFLMGAGSVIRASYGGAEQTVPPGFLYDGKDMYVFLEPVSVSTGGYSVDLPALSYAEAVNLDSLILFNYETKESELFDADQDAQAIASDYSVQLFSDTMIVPDGTRRMLYSDPSVVKPMFTAGN